MYVGLLSLSLSLTSECVTLKIQNTNVVGTPPIPSDLPTKLRMYTLDLSSHDTTPPSYLAEHELVSLMERHGVGTDASMATHIGNIQSRDYVTLGPGRTLVPTEMGLTLVCSLSFSVCVPPPHTYKQTNTHNVGTWISSNRS